MAKLNNIELVNQMIAEGYIDVTKHPVFDLYLYNYSKAAQFAHLWNEATEQCRGIICDKDMNIVARPFKKFYNYEELVADGRDNEIPDLPFEVYEKKDGSLGILYFGEDGEPYIATRGSFNSPQAEHATQLLRTKYRSIWDKLDKAKTYLFEIIYPEDLHVVSYHGADDIFLLAVINTETGEEDDIYKYRDLFNTTTRYDGVKDYLKVRELFSSDNKEGFVIKFSNNFRMKLKFADYWKLHFLKAGFTEKAIFGYLASGDTESIDAALSMFDEEHTLYYKAIVNKITDKYNDIVDTCMHEYRDDFENRKDAAAYFNTCVYPAVMFRMYSHQDTNQVVWNYTSQALYHRPWNLKSYLLNKDNKFYMNMEDAKPDYSD